MEANSSLLYMPGEQLYPRLDANPILNSLHCCWSDNPSKEHEDLRELFPAELDIQGSVSKVDPMLQVVYAPRLVR